jgi:hypothetical protein
MLCFPVVCGAQDPDVIPLKSEPHHHLVLHNDFVNVYSVQVQPHDSVLLHKHTFDAIGIMLGDAEITVSAPGKPDSHQKIGGGQLRLQQAGYIHSTVIDGDTAYLNVTVELLLPQQEGRNICARLMSIQPLNCPSAHADSAALLEQPQFETNQTKISLIRLKPRQSFTLETSPRNRLVVVLDEVAVLSGANNPSKALHSGDILWRDSHSPAQLFENAGNKEIRLVTFAFTNVNSAK